MEMTLEQQRAIALANARLRAQEQEQGVEQEQDRSVGQELLRQLGLTGRYAVEAFTAPATVALEAGRAGVNLASEALGSDFRLPSPAAAQGQMLTNVGLPQPEGMLERAVGSGTQAMANTAGFAKALPKVAAFAQDLYRQIPGAGIAGLTSQPAAEITRNVTGSDFAAFLAGAGLSVLTGTGTAKLADSITKSKGVLLTPQEVKDRATASYNRLDEQGVAIKPKSVLNLVDDIKMALDDAKLIQGTNEASTINTYLKQVESIVGQTRVSFNKLEKIRSTLNDLKISQDPNVSRFGNVIIDKIDDYITNLNAKDVIAGKEGLSAAVKAVTDARKDWRNASRASVLEDALNVAEVRALNPKASEGELIRQAFINLAANKTKMRFFSQQEQNIIKSVASGGNTDKLLTALAAFNPLRSKIAAAAGAYTATSNPIMAGSVAATGLGADLAQGMLRRGAAQEAINRIASGATQPGPSDLYFQGLLNRALNQQQPPTLEE